MSIVARILSEASLNECLDFHLFEAATAKNGWIIKTNSLFKRGFKKYSNDKRVKHAFDTLIDYIQNHDGRPTITDYPSEYNVHAVKKEKISGKVKNAITEDSLTCHLKGQKIIMIFSVSPDKVIYLIFMGTHQEAGWK